MSRLRWAVQVDRWVPGPDEFDLLLSLLPEPERQQCTKFTKPEDRKRALVSRLLQRRAATAALGLRHEAVVCKRTRGNKPYVANELTKPAWAPNWNYSVSHEVRMGLPAELRAVPSPWLMPQPTAPLQHKATLDTCENIPHLALAG